VKDFDEDAFIRNADEPSVHSKSNLDHKDVKEDQVDEMKTPLMSDMKFPSIPFLESAKRTVNEHEYFKTQCLKVMNELNGAGLECMLYETQTTDPPMFPCVKQKKPRLAFLLVGATESRLRQEADRQDYHLRMDPTAILSVAETKKRVLLLAERVLNHKIKSFQPDIMENLYAPYNIQDDVQEFYARYHDEGPLHQSTLFRTVDRIKLIDSIIQLKVTRGGAGLKVPALMLEPNNCVAYFPLHNDEHKSYIKSLISFGALFRMPVAEMREYFGEEIAIYFGFLNYFTRMLVVPALAGTILYIYQLVKDFTNGTAQYVVNAYGALAYTCIICIWATLLCEYWKQEQSRLAVVWGVNTVASGSRLKREKVRPEFEGVMQISEVNGSFVEDEDKGLQKRKMCTSIFTVCVFVLLLLGCVTGMYSVQSLLIKSYPTLGSYYAATISSALITTMNMLYAKVSDKLNDYENHKTESSYIESKIWKGFVFRFINSYNSMFYIAFVQPQLGECPCQDVPLEDQGDCPLVDPDCMITLSQSLVTVFATQMIINNAFEMLSPWWHRKQVKKSVSKALTEPEEDYLMAPEVNIHDDFDELVVTFGYSTMFAVAFPLGFLLALVSNFIELKLDSSKYLEWCRRSMPRSTANIGTWYFITEIMSALCVLTNLAIFFFVSNAGRSISQELHIRLFLFIAIEHFLIFIKFLCSAVIPDEKDWVNTFRQRQQHIVNIIIEGKKESVERETDLKKLSLPEIQSSLKALLKKAKEDGTGQSSRSMDDMRRIVEANMPRPILFSKGGAKRQAGKVRFRGVLLADHAVDCGCIWCVRNKEYNLIRANTREQLKNRVLKFEE
jgi:hypothetical protein